MAASLPVIVGLLKLEQIYQHPARMFGQSRSLTWMVFATRLGQHDDHQD
jgi:hypothetical protein